MTYYGQVTKKEVIAYYGTQVAAARALGITKVSVGDWSDDEPIPELRARQLHEITGGKLKFRPEDYKREIVS
jgi:hypothetical protein